MGVIRRFLDRLRNRHKGPDRRFSRGALELNAGKRSTSIPDPCCCDFTGIEGCCRTGRRYRSARVHSPPREGHYQVITVDLRRCTGLYRNGRWYTTLLEPLEVREWR